STRGGESFSRRRALTLPTGIGIVPPMTTERVAEIEVEDGVARVIAPPGFALVAALRAAYYRIGDFHVAVDQEGDRPTITLRPKSPLDGEALVAAAERLARDLPDAELRTALL